MDEESVFMGGDNSEATQQDSIENTPLHVSAVHGDHTSHTVKPAAAAGRPAALASSIHDNTVARPLTVKGDTAESLLAARCDSSSQSPPKSGTMARKSFCEFGCSAQVVQVVSSPLVVVSSDEEIQLGRGTSPPHDRRAVHLPAPSTTAVVPSAAVRSTPLIPEKAHVERNALSPPSLHRSHLRAAPTGGSDSDTEEESNCSRHATPDAGRRNSRIGNESAVEAEEREAEQHLVDEFGFVIDEDAKERDGKYIRGIDGKQVVRREIKWANMAADWNKTNTKMHAKLKERCRKGIPSRFRGVAWQLLMGSFHQLNSEENSGVYVALRDKKLADKETDAVISRDLARTFPTHVLFQDPGGVGQTFLRNVLHAYAGCDPEVGYVQGMGFIVAALSTQMAEEESFWALHEMMYNDRYKMRELFRPGFPLLQQFFYQLKRLIARLLPRLSKRLEELEIQPSFFASQWFLTLFVGHFPFRALLRVWDIFFSEGWKIIFRTGIALLKWEESHLLTLSFEDTLLALKGLQDGKDAYELLRRAHRVKFKTAELNRYGDEYWEMIGSIHRD
ncbi:Rab-like GTPase activating protein, putative [Leishmania tarentolae]|uniref:Rab-like GTPase activating protein, putative n=1 Tax=Leishmania tarentolae TaxID=5689 RepID=A0A640KVW1_LEITA|nr:Rab-like GTPase activating protein, putative [Leishmania tarentolae]